MSEEKKGSTSDYPDGDRRAGERHFACFPAYVERSERGPRLAIIHDLSTAGALLLVRSRLQEGDIVKLQLFITDKMDEFRVARGKVVRIEPLKDEAVGLWSRRVAVQFDAPLTIYEAEIQALKERQAKLGGVST